MYEVLESRLSDILPATGMIMCRLFVAESDGSLNAWLTGVPSLMTLPMSLLSSPLSRRMSLM